MLQIDSNVLAGECESDEANNKRTDIVTSCVPSSAVYSSDFDDCNITVPSSAVYKCNPGSGDITAPSSVVYNSNPDDSYDEIPDNDFVYDEIADSHSNVRSQNVDVYNEIVDNNSDNAGIDTYNVYNEITDNNFDVYDEIAGKSSANVYDDVLTSLSVVIKCESIITAGK